MSRTNESDALPINKVAMRIYGVWCDVDIS